jgi:hypothetical protein
VVVVHVVDGVAFGACGSSDGRVEVVIMVVFVVFDLVSIWCYCCCYCACCCYCEDHVFYISYLWRWDLLVLLTLSLKGF